MSCLQNSVKEPANPLIQNTGNVLSGGFANMGKGVYALIIKLDKEKTIPVGKLGSITFKPGFYVYAGSAMNSLEKRIQRHFSKTKALHWHIDYFLLHAKPLEARTLEKPKHWECRLARFLEKISDSFIPKFGSSDCKCKSHLFFFQKDPRKSKNFLEKIQ